MDVPKLRFKDGKPQYAADAGRLSEAIGPSSRCRTEAEGSFLLPDRVRVAFPTGGQLRTIPPVSPVIDEPSPEDTAYVRRVIERFARPDDLVVLSGYRGAPWGYQIPSAQRHGARPLVNEAGVDRGPGMKSRSSSSGKSRSALT